MKEIKTLGALVALIFIASLLPFFRDLKRARHLRQVRGGRNLKNYMRGDDDHEN